MNFFKELKSIRREVNTNTSKTDGLELTDEKFELLLDAIKDAWYQFKTLKNKMTGIKWYQVWKFKGLIVLVLDFIRDIEDILFND